MGIQNWSLRYKLLLALAGLPAVGVFLITYIAIEAFKSDKVAYIFDSNLYASESLSNQLEIIFQQQLDRVQSQLSQSPFSVGGDALSADFLERLSRVSEISGVALYAEGRVMQATLLRDPEGQGAVPFQKRVENQLRQTDLKSNRSFFVAPSGGKSPYANSLIVPIKYQNQDRYIVVEFLTPALRQLIEQVSSRGVLVANDEGLALFSTLKFKDALRDQLKRFQGSKISSTQKLIDAAGEAWLLAVSPNPRFGFTTFVSTSEALALEAISNMRRQLFFLFLSLVFASVFLGLFLSGRLIAPIETLVSAARRISRGDFNFQLERKSQDEVGDLVEAFQRMKDEISHLLLETAEKARMEGELKTAQTVQETLFPDPYYLDDRVEISGFYQPASECGGDWWHYSRKGDFLHIWIGDATGHGAPAALLTSAAKSAASIIESFDVGPAQALHLMNRSIFEISKGNLMMTFFFGRIDLRTGVLKYSNASHDPPLVFQKRSEGVEIKKKDLIPLNEVRCPRLGESKDSNYEEAELKLDSGAGVFLYTDGVTELYGPNSTMLGERNFFKLFLKANNESLTVKTATQNLFGELESFRSSEPLRDDVTFFQIQYTAGGGS